MSPHASRIVPRAARRSVLRDARTRGFTLLEVMAALVIFMVGIVGVLALFATGLGLHQDATQRTIVAIATEEVRTRVEEALEDLTAPDAVLPEFREVAVKGRPGYFFDVDLEVDSDLGLAGGVMAKVFVYTREAGVKDGERFTLFVTPGRSPENLIRKARGEKIDPPSPPAEGAGGGR